MASYKIEWKSSAAKELRSLPKEVIAEIVARVTSLGDRIRFSSYRVIYTVAKENRIVEIVRVGHRQSVYKH